MLAFTSKSFRNPKHVALWLSLAFQAGAINAGGWITCHSFVSHVTGVGTQIGMHIGQQNLLTAYELLAAPVSFILGAVASGFLIDRPRALGKKPRYVTAMFIIFGLLAFVFGEGLYGEFGEFGEPLLLGRDVLLLSVLSFVCGLQNASVTSATRGAIRTTHLTGISTDLGLNWVKVLYLPRFSRERYRELLINRVRLGTFVSFSLGSALGALVFLRYHYLGFALPASTALALLGISWRANHRSHLATAAQARTGHGSSREVRAKQVGVGSSRKASA
jgi:uncharacterized membrane protein YoaK (UPF0700 family)